MPSWSNESAVERAGNPPADISINPLPALVIFLLGGTMSSHEQSSMVSTMVHKQWGNLLGAAAFSRLLTYTMVYLKPPTSLASSRPPTELIMAFCLISGGILFMASVRSSHWTSQFSIADVYFSVKRYRRRHGPF